MSTTLAARQMPRTVSTALSSSQPVQPSQLCIACIRRSYKQEWSNPSRRLFQTSTTRLRASTGVLTAHNEPCRKPGPSKLSSRASTRSLFTKKAITQNDTSDVENRATAAAAKARAKVFETAGNVAPVLGSLATNSIFAANQRDADVRDIERDSAAGVTDPSDLSLRNPSHLAAALNPNPNARTRWHRRMVIRSMRHRGRVSPEVKIARTERQLLMKSHFFKTSMKKLAPLARQIAGKGIDDAILQMRFSKKKAAKEVLEHLIQAKNEAIVTRGMGLGHLDTPTETKSTSPSPAQEPSSEANPGAPKAPSKTDMYIAQSWVNRGPYGQTPDFRARGQVYIMRPPKTGLSVILKEEVTRIREKAEKEEKKIKLRMGKSMWTPLPDRKVVRQSQYLLW